MTPQVNHQINRQDCWLNIGFYPIRIERLVRKFIDTARREIITEGGVYCRDSGLLEPSARSAEGESASAPLFATLCRVIICV